MGRGKLKMELIAKEKSRLITFKKRKECLIRKIHEFTTLCDVSTCMIIYGPKQEPGSETWPANRDEVKRVIDVYRAKSRGLGNRTYGLPDFFLGRKRKLEDEFKKIRKKNMEAMHPTWLEFMNYIPEARMRVFAADLSAKAERVRAMIKQMRRIQHGPQITMDMGDDNQPYVFYDPGLVLERQQTVEPYVFHDQENPGLVWDGHQTEAEQELFYHCNR